MISKRLYFIIIIFIIGISLISCSKNDQETDYVEFLGTESYFKFTDEIIPDILIDTLIHYSDSVGDGPSRELLCSSAEYRLFPE